MKEKIEKIEVNGEPFYVDYVGKKSKAYNDKETRSVDPLRYMSIVFHIVTYFVHFSNCYL